MSRGRPDHGRRNLPFSASLRHRWWCDLVIRNRRNARMAGAIGAGPRTRKERNEKCTNSKGTGTETPEA
ncbi:MAG: hypothetical protein A4E42_02020 [Methanoregulaceae archaeon PtaU1.Bin222]|nr:MAG: hypothetical protein A4E42_02020 [Methanoregulaceae archaeon PtaU1.Bin222]